MTLGRLVVSVLAAWLALDVGLRFAPASWFGANPFAAAVRHPAGTGSFAPNFSARASGYVGDAVLEANRAPTEQRGPVRVTFDARGFRRNPFLAPHEQPDVLMLGGVSFGYGAGLSDHETLPAALARAGDLRVYNGALSHEDELSVRRLDRVLAGLPGRPRSALLLVVEHQTPTPAPRRGRAARLVAAHPALGPAVARAQAARRALGAAHRRVTRWWAFSPLDMVSSRLFRRLGDDRVLPNEYARGTRTLPLPDGRAMIIRRYELQPALDGRSPADAPPMADDVARWRDSLAARGIATRVLLLPSRYTVYGSRLEEHGRRAAPRSVAAYVDQVADELRARGIPTLNALALFRDAAADELRTGALSFYREDNHWNARGVTRVAEVLADSLAVWDAAAVNRARE